MCVDALYAWMCNSEGRCGCEIKGFPCMSLWESKLGRKEEGTKGQYGTLSLERIDSAWPSHGRNEQKDFPSCDRCILYAMHPSPPILLTRRAYSYSLTRLLLFSCLLLPCNRLLPEYMHSVKAVKTGIYLEDGTGIFGGAWVHCFSSSSSEKKKKGSHESWNDANHHPWKLCTRDEEEGDGNREGLTVKRRGSDDQPAMLFCCMYHQCPALESGISTRLCVYVLDGVIIVVCMVGHIPCCVGCSPIDDGMSCVYVSVERI